MDQHCWFANVNLRCWLGCYITDKLGSLIRAFGNNQ
jgi:hypothetical protein